MLNLYLKAQRKTLVILLSLTSAGVFAQNNYIATTPSSSTPGTNNTLVGINAGQSMNSTSNSNAFFGGQAGSGNTTGSSNTFIGFQAGFGNTTANVNTFLGYRAGYSNGSGSGNVFIGSEAGFNNTTGTGNMFLGQQAGANNTSGSYNLFMGNAAGGKTTTGLGNTSIGDGSGFGNTTGNRNTNIGQYAGIDNGTGSDNTFIGFGASPGSPDLSNAVAIGSGSRVNISNAIVLGNNANVGIGTSSPANKLEITAGTANKSGLRFTNLTGASNSLLSLSISVANPIVKVLTVDNNGDVVLAGLGVNLGAVLGGRVAAPDSWTTNDSSVQSISDKPVVIGGGVDRIPTGYKLFVSGGILTERVKVAVKNSSEWADYVFADNYKLRSLNEVEQFIRKNKHLPGVPSAEEVAKQGIDVGKMDAKLLEKIEELTLYMLELKKENQEMKKIISELSQAKCK